jgi:SPP1 family phage portal protein
MTAVTQAYNYLAEDNPINGTMIGELIKENTPRHHRQMGLYERFKGTQDGVPVLNRTFPIENYSKINNKLANDFFGDIVNTKVGYFAGRPISYKYVEEDDKGEVIKTTDANTLLKGFLKRNQIADMDSETAKFAAVAGMAARLCYIDTDGEAALINVPPWECIFICDEIGVTDAPYAIRYYQVERGGKKFTKAEFYDETTVSYWIHEGDDLNSDVTFVLDPADPPVSHLMSGCPLCAFPNNEEMIGDAERVLSLIDGYDRTLSDVNSEIEQFRLAYLFIHGMTLTDEQIDKLRQTAVLCSPEETGGAEFVTKNLNDVAVENHLMKLEDNILRFAQSVRFTDESFGQASGVAMKFKLFNLESKCMTAERKFQKGLYHQFEVLQGYFQKVGITYDPWLFNFVFTRNFPLNLVDEAQALATLKGLVSDQTAFGQMSFIENPEKEIEQMKAEQQDMASYETALNKEMGLNPDGSPINQGGMDNGMQGQNQGQETTQVRST